MNTFNFVLTYVIIPMIVGIGIILGKGKRNIQRIRIMVGMKGIFYFYLAISTFVSYFGEAEMNKFAVGLTIAIAIIEGCTALADVLFEIK